MGPTSAIVLYAVVWFMVFFVVLPIGLSTQGDEGEIVPGTHAGSPARFPLKRKVIQTTIWGTLIWAVIAGVILSGWIEVRDFDWFDRMPPREAVGGDTNG
ncbi:DUF1467 family protein [Palleronia abyssalis]|uniref:Uncharacterized protein n=1 Tax=Palleronia abyssalis TaxID=1501240 RepID=A0A2R8BYL0_9RHOB|nr:DUF1467 family protein [Palleronia abyssalis]SPJ25166.1 hypothetical protein PAA8504_03014 [Palleronia abyssalis]